MPTKPTKKITKSKKTKDVCTAETCTSKHNIFHKIISHHIHKHGNKVLHLTHMYNHALIHSGELLLVGCISIAGFISASFTPNPSTEMITDHAIIGANLVNAEQKGAPSANDPRIISMRTMDSSVNNSFYPGYCTYGAARISPEFFPFTDASTQQRTWGGNAVDRCENAQATGYSIGSRPVEGALIVYGKGGNGGVFGHVGKVMYYNSSRQSLIIRDMNRVSKFIMTDRRETSTNPNIKCFIYNRKPTATVVINTPTTPDPIITTPTQPVITPTQPITTPTQPITTPTQPITTPTQPVITPTQPITTPTQPVVAPTQPVVAPTPETHNEEFKLQTLGFNFENISDLAKHFLTQRNLKGELTTKDTLKIGDTATLTLTIKDLATQAGFEGLLDLPIELIASNDNITTNYSLIQLIKDGKIDISITAKNKGETTLLINFDGERIGKINFTVE